MFFLANLFLLSILPSSRDAETAVTVYVTMQATDDGTEDAGVNSVLEHLYMYMYTCTYCISLISLRAACISRTDLCSQLFEGARYSKVRTIQLGLTGA